MLWSRLLWLVIINSVSRKNIQRNIVFTHWKMLFPTTIGSGVQFIRVFLDASKAFDWVEHWSLFKKLIDRNVPLVVVRLLVHWYRQQTLCVKWGRNTSSFFTVTNGVRQGGILSPFLFTLYVDDLSHRLNNSKVGCHINNVCINHLFYADDLCLMAPSPVGLQLLIDICANYGFENDILFNRSKSMCMVVKPRGRNVSTPFMFLNGDALEYVDSVKYLGYEGRCRYE